MSEQTSGTERLLVIDSELASLHTRMGELYDERVVLQRQLGAQSLGGADVRLDWFKDQYELTVAALGELGFGEKDGIPSLKQVEDSKTAENNAWLAARRHAGHQDEFVISPSVQSIGLMGTRRNPGLIPRFDKRQSSDNKTYVWKPLWRNKFDDKDPLHDNGQGASGSFYLGVLLGDKTDPFNPRKRANKCNEPGLVFTDMNVRRQRDALACERSRSGVHELSEATIGQIVTVNAARRLAGLPMLDQRTSSRLVHYPDRSVDREVCVPTVYSHGRQLKLDRSYVKDGCDDAGVRRSLRVPLKASA